MFNFTNNIVQGSYETLTDDQGHQLIDLTGGFGYQIPEIIQAVTQQSQLMGLSNRVLLSQPLIQLCKHLAGLLPKNLKTSYVCNSGDEAFEGALKLAKGLKPHAKTILYIEGGDFGSLTFGRCMSNPEEYKEVMQFLGISFICINSSEELEAVSNWQNIIAVCHTGLIINELDYKVPINKVFLQQVYKVAKRKRTPVISVDVKSCLGHMGTLFAHQFYEVEPDIVVLGDGLGGGAIPIGTYTSSEEMASKVYGRSSPAKHGSTTAGNPLSCIAAIQAMTLAVSNDFAAKASENGKLLAESLDFLEVKVIGGLVNLPLPKHIDPLQLQATLYKAGVYVHASENQRVIYLHCPLTARSAQIKKASLIIREIMNHANIVESKKIA